LIACAFPEPAPNFDVHGEPYPSYDILNFLKDSAKGSAASFGRPVSEKDRQNDHNS